MADINEELNAATGVRTVTVDNGDGTGTRTVYDADGNVTSTEQLTGLAVVVVPLPTDPLLDATDPRDTTKIRRT